MSIAWVAQLTYNAPGLTPDDIATLTEALEDGGVTYQANTGVLQITLEVTADTLRDACEYAQTAAAVTGLLKPSRLYVLPAADFLAAGGSHPGLDATDLVGMTEIGRILGVSRQRASTLAKTEPGFPKPARPGPRGVLYSRANIEAFGKRWKATRNPRGGPRPRTSPPPMVQTSQEPTQLPQQPEQRLTDQAMSSTQQTPMQLGQPILGDDHYPTSG